MKLISFTFLSFFMVSSLFSQTIYYEDFEASSTLPSGWTIETNATDGGWNVGTAGSLSSQSFEFIDNGTNNIIGTNDDQCNCNKNNDFLISPAIDLTGYDKVILQFDSYFTDQTYQVQEDVKIELSLDKQNWMVLDDLHGHGSWDKHTYDISEFGDAEQIFIGFRYSDGGGWLYGFAIDNFRISVPLASDAALVELEDKSFGILNEEFPLRGVIQNGGSDPINTIEITYDITGQETKTYLFENVMLGPFAYYNFQINEPWVPTESGDYNIAVNLVSINGSPDADLSNNSMDFDVTIYGDVTVPNRIDEYIGFIPEKNIVANSSNSLNKPSDLDFFPILAKDELWIVNQNTENQGGSTTIIQDASDDVPSDIINRVDGNAWHFMSLPTGIAFSDDNLNFANSPGVKDANHGGGTFTGPALWSSDLTIYAQPSGGNGSHLDMLHGSPFSMGIAHEVDNTFWVYDDWNHDIVRYDFVEDHGPGNDDHSDGIVRRYKNIGIDTEGDIPNHLILDKLTGWLYFTDNGNDRVMRLDINSGTGSSTLPLINEPLAEHSSITGFIVEEIITGIDQPCGIELMGSNLLITDYGTGDILVYSTASNFTFKGKISTEEPGIAGIKVGPDGTIWYVNRENNTLVNIEPSAQVSTEEINNDLKVRVSPNPNDGYFTINTPLELNGEKLVKLIDMNGKQILEKTFSGSELSIDQKALNNGIYILQISNGSIVVNKKVNIYR